MKVITIERGFGEVCVAYESKDGQTTFYNSPQENRSKVFSLPFELSEREAEIAVNSFYKGKSAEKVKGRKEVRDFIKTLLVDKAEE